MLAFQAPWLPEILFAANDYETIDSMFRLPPTGCRRPGAISAEEVERQGSMEDLQCCNVQFMYPVVYMRCLA